MFTRQIFAVLFHLYQHKVETVPSSLQRREYTSHEYETVMYQSRWVSEFRTILQSQ